jgi:hypothetical protein
MKSRTKVFVLLTVCLMGLFVAGALYSIEQRFIEMRCQQDLKNLRELMALYIGSHNALWPSSMTELLREEDAPEIAEVSPAVGKPGEDDYIYIDWQQFANGPKWGFDRFPVIYDRQLSNHGGRGIYILLTNGDVIWDSGATWLRQFAAEHQEDRIPIPY